MNVLFYGTGTCATVYYNFHANNFCGDIQSARFRNKIEKKTAVFIYMNTEQSSLEIKII